MHNNEELFRQTVLRAAEYHNISPAIIEKDYYVTLFLKNIVKELPQIIFKGGTSLSKCYKLIDRFSEDIDLNIDTEITIHIIIAAQLIRTALLFNYLLKFLRVLAQILQ